MTRTAIRHTLRALAAITLVSAFADAPVLAGDDVTVVIDGVAASKSSYKPAPPSELAAKHSRRSKSISDPGVRKALSLTDEQ